jgi:hypothetical protein
METKILSINESSQILQRFPQIELSYETISHKKVSPSYQLAIAIPQGKKFYAWFSFYENKDVLFIIELNKEKKITHILRIPVPNYDQQLFYGTLFYGVVLLDEPTVDSPIFPKNNNKKRFLIEDCFNYRGIPMKKNTFGSKMPWIFDFLQKWKTNHSETCEIDFFVPAMWHYNVLQEPENSESILPMKYKTLPYQVHHIQYRCMSEIAPFLNYPITKNFCSKNSASNALPAPMVTNIVNEYYKNFRPDFNKPQYRSTAIFQVTADIQFDIYHLFAYGKNKSQVYYNIAYIPNYKTSVFMNGLFRNIKENRNLDYIEESDDEDDFQNTSLDKYVNLQKVLFLECKFHPKFKRWVPLRTVKQPCKVIHIGML